MTFSLRVRSISNCVFNCLLNSDSVSVVFWMKVKSFINNSQTLCFWPPGGKAIWKFFKLLVLFLCFHSVLFEIFDVYIHFGFVLIAVSLFFRFSISSSFELTVYSVFEWILVDDLARWCWILLGQSLSNFCSHVGLSLAIFILLLFLEMFPCVLELLLFPLTALA